MPIRWPMVLVNDLRHKEVRIHEDGRMTFAEGFTKHDSPEIALKAARAAGYTRIG